MSFRAATALALLLLSALFSGCYSPTLPLPPPAREGLVVSTPDENGFVVVIGEPGVMDPGEQAVIINMSTFYGWIVPVDEDGAFEAIIMASVGDTLNIQRRVGDELGQSVNVVVPGPD